MSWSFGDETKKVGGRTVRRDKERVVDDGDERGSVDCRGREVKRSASRVARRKDGKEKRLTDRIVGSQSVNGSVGLNGVSSVSGDVKDRSVGDVQLLSPHGPKLKEQNIDSATRLPESSTRSTIGLTGEEELAVTLAPREVT